MRGLFRVLADIWPSIVASVLAAVGAFLSMGMLGLLLYWLTSPALTLFFPPLDAWDQSVVWPLLIGVPFIWSISFLPAALINRHLSRLGWRRAARIGVYVALIWLAAFASWSLLLALNPDVWR